MVGIPIFIPFTHMDDHRCSLDCVMRGAEDSCHARLDMSDALAANRNCTIDHFIIRGREATGLLLFGGFTKMMSPWSLSLKNSMKGEFTVKSNEKN